MKTHDVIIIGAGIAGLGAAYEAKKKGLSFIVLEAQDRVGGRIHSQKLKNGLVVELGAEWVSKTDTTLLKLCRTHTLKLEKHTYTNTRFIYKDGTEFHNFRSLMQRYEEVAKQANVNHLKRSLTWYEYLKKYFSHEEMRKLNIAYSTDFAEHIRYVSAKAALSDVSGGGDNDHMDYHVVGGNSRIIEALTKKIGKRNIHISTTVTNVESTPSQTLRVNTNHGAYLGKNVLFTIAADSLKHITFSPNLPRHKKLARKLSYGDITKLFLSFKTPLPLKKQNFAMLTDGPFQYVYVPTQGQSKDKFALCVYAVGKHAREIVKMDTEKLWNKLKHILPKDVFDVQNMNPVERISKHWGCDRFTHGAYAVFQPHEHEAILDTFQSHTKNIYFAGEYLGPEGMFGYMNGALESGQNAIKRMRF